MKGQWPCHYSVPGKNPFLLNVSYPRRVKNSESNFRRKEHRDICMKYSRYGRQHGDVWQREQLAEKDFILVLSFSFRVLLFLLFTFCNFAHHLALTMTFQFRLCFVLTILQINPCIYIVISYNEKTLKTL